MVRSLDQKNRDRNRRTYRITGMPHDMTDQEITAWVRSISGTLRGSNMRFGGTPTIAFELWATSEGMTHRLKIPWQHSDYVISQLRALVPGIRITPEDDFPTRQWTKAVEVGLTHSTRPLRIFDSADMASSLLASFQPLEGDETVLMQWVVTPAVPQHKPIYRQAHSDMPSLRYVTHGSLASKDEVRDRREKLEEPNVLAVLRVAATAKTDVRADHLIYRVRASLAATRGPATRFVKRLVAKGTLQARITEAAGLNHFPAQLSASELASLIAWPIGRPFVSGLPPYLARQLPAMDNVPREGRIFGLSNFPGNERAVALDYISARKHAHVVGPTGSGKTVMLSNMVRQDMEAGFGVVVIDAKGGSGQNLFTSALDYVPRRRIEDVIILDVNDPNYPIAFNILDQGDVRVIIDELTDLFESMYDGKGVWTRLVLYHGLRTLATVPGLAFTDLAALLVPMSSDDITWRDNLIRSLKDKELKQFWQRFDNQSPSTQDRITQPVMDRIWQLTARPELRNIIGQSQSSFQMSEVIAQNKILLVNLGGIGEESASLAGTLLLDALWRAVKTSAGINQVNLYMDEFQKFLRLPIDPESMLAEARGFGLSMTLAHQHLNQLPRELRQAVLANARTKIVFQTTADDGAAFAKEFGSSVTENDFMHLGKYECLARVATGDGVSAPLTLTASKPVDPYGTAKWARYVSKQKYGRSVMEVELEMESRRRSAEKPRPQRKAVNDEGWADMGL